MAALSFPNSPSVGQTYTFNNRTYTWDGTTWSMSAGAAASAMMAIGKVVCVGGETTIVFNNIPQTFSDLQLVLSGRDTGTGTGEVAAQLKINGDGTAANYSAATFIVGSGTAATSGTVASTTAGASIGIIPGTSGNANAIGQTVVTIANYAGASFHKLVEQAISYTFGSSLRKAQQFFEWKSNAAVTSLTVTANASFASGTTAVLYGIGGTAYSALASADPSVAQGRLALTSGTPVTTTDVTGATSVYWTPYKGNRISLYDGAGTWCMYTFSELALALGTLTSGANYDVFAYANNGVAALELGPAWTNDTTRATALVMQDGVYVKSGATTRKYLGTFRTTSTTTTEDSAVKRFVWNCYNRARRPMQRLETTASWTYGTTAWHQANASAANQLDVVIGLAEDAVSVRVEAFGTNAGTASWAIGIGLDSTTTPSGTVCHGNAINGSGESGAAFLDVVPGIGRHFFAWLEYADTGKTITFTSANTSSFPVQSGLAGVVLG